MTLDAALAMAAQGPTPHSDPPPNAWAKEQLYRRMFHEDELFAQRASQFLIANAFLVVAFVTLLGLSLGSGLADSSRVILPEGAIVFLGLFLSFFHIALGRRHVIGISFWRVYEEKFYTKATSQNAADLWVRDQHAFYKTGRSDLVTGEILPDPAEPYEVDKEVRMKGAVAGSFPWAIKPIASTNRVVGELFPAAVVLFWTIVSFSIDMPWAYHEVPLIGALVMAVTIVLFLVMALNHPRLPKFVGH